MKETFNRDVASALTINANFMHLRFENKSNWQNLMHAFRQDQQIVL